MWRLLVLSLVATASAQIPALGWCPDYQPMANFNMNRFLGKWFEAERYFTISELVSRCVTTTYESTPEGRILISNEITNSLTGMKRVMDGHLQMIGREGEGRIIVKYSSLPVPYDTEFSILGTDYDNYAVIWSCSGIGPVHAQNAWVLTRDRIASTAVMQAAYGVLDKFKISRTFFVRTNQADCTVLPNPAADPSDLKEELDGKNVGVVPEVVDKVVDSPVEKRVQDPVLDVVPQERVANPVKELEPQPMNVPELIMSESSKKKEEIVEKPAELEKEKKVAEVESCENETKKTEKPMQ